MRHESKHQGDPAESILRALYGIVDCEVTTDGGKLKPILAHLHEPPSYAVLMLLCGIARLKNLGPDDKTAWQVQVRFRDNTFRIRDWKRSSWSIDGDVAASKTRSVADSLVKKLRSAGKCLDIELSKALRVHLKDENYYVDNAYYKVYPLYKHFKEEVRRARNQKERFVQRVRQKKLTTKPKVMPSNAQKTWHFVGGILTTILNKSVKLDKKTVYAASAMVVFFFSYTEMLFELLYVFGDRRDMTFQEFRRLSWKEKFRRVLPVAGDKKGSELYRELLAIKQSFRDVLAHGFTDDSSVLVPFKELGLIPISYERRSQSIASSWISYSDEPGVKAMSCFERFERWLSEYEPSHYVIQYAQSGFEIPVEKEAISAIRKQMTTPKQFKGYLMEESYRRDFLQEQY